MGRPSESLGESGPSEPEWSTFDAPRAIPGDPGESGNRGYRANLRNFGTVVAEGEN